MPRYDRVAADAQADYAAMEPQEYTDYVMAFLRDKPVAPVASDSPS
jgi:hypothetical protein